MKCFFLKLNKKVSFVPHFLSSEHYFYTHKNLKLQRETKKLFSKSPRVRGSGKPQKECFSFCGFEIKTFQDLKKVISLAQETTVVRKTKCLKVPFGEKSGHDLKEGIVFHNKTCFF